MPTHTNATQRNALAQIYVREFIIYGNVRVAYTHETNSF